MRRSRAGSNRGPSDGSRWCRAPSEATDEDQPIAGGEPRAREGADRRAERAGVGVTPPSAVMVDPDADPTGLRLCLGAPSRADLERALKTLAGLAAGEGESGGV